MYRKLIVERLDPDFRKATAITEAVLPVPNETQALVRLAYAGINASDVNFSAGRYLPGVAPPLDCGFEGVGVVEIAGGKAAEAGFAVGAAVAVVKYGCFAEYVLIDLQHKPTKLAPSCAAYLVKAVEPRCLPLLIGGLTSSIGLEQAGEMGSGEVVMVTGAAGGTGAFAVQLAALAGNRVIGTCSSDDKVVALKRLGCERAINRNKEDIESVLKSEYPEGVDLVFEGVGGEMLEICKRNLSKEKGRLVVHGYTSQYAKQDSLKSEEAKLLHLKGKGRIRGFFLGNFGHLQQQHLKQLQELVEAGKLEPLCDDVNFEGLEHVADAVEHLHGAKNIGKVLVAIDKEATTPLGKLGPIGAAVGDCVEVNGLESESGQKLNGSKGAVMAFLPEKQRYAVRFAPESVVNLKPENLRLLDAEEKVESMTAELLAAPEAAQIVCERHGADVHWLLRTRGEQGKSVEELQAALGVGGSELDDRGKLLGLLGAMLSILNSEATKQQLTQIREACGTKADFEKAKAEHIYPQLGPAYGRFQVDWAWQEATTNALKGVDEEVAAKCNELEAALSFSVGGPLNLEKSDYVEIFGLESEGGMKLNGEKAFVQAYDLEKSRYLVLLPPDEQKHIKPENLRRVPDLEKLRSILGQAVVRLGTPAAKNELDELRKSCESREHFEGAKFEKIAKLMERILTRYAVDLAWIFGMLTQYSAEDEGIGRHKEELDKLLTFGMGPKELCKGDCVEVEGIKDSGGPAKLEGKRGFVSEWLEAKECYAVKFPPENYFVDIKPEFLKKISDKDKVSNIMSRAVTSCKQAKNDMKDLRAKATDRASFERIRGEMLQQLMGGTCTRYGVDLGWFFAMSEHLANEDSELKEQREELMRLIAFDTGPLTLEKNEAVVAEGIDSQPQLNGKVAFMQCFDEGKGRYTVLFPPSNIVNLKPENIRRCTEREKLLSWQEQAYELLCSAAGRSAVEEMRNAASSKAAFEAAKGEKVAGLLAPVATLTGLDLGWYVANVAEAAGIDEEVAEKAKDIDELISWGTIGPSGFEKGSTCVEVFGLESEAGRPMNGQKGVVSKWIAEKERYEVQFGSEKVMSLKPGNLRKLEDRERLLCLQRQLVEVMGQKEIAGPINRLRKEATTVLQYGRASAKFFEKAMNPVFERYGVDGGWRDVMLSIYGEDEEVKAATAQLAELTGWGTVGPEKWERGCYLEVYGLTSEAGMKMNGMAVFLKGYDDAKGRYDVSPADDLAQTKALKGDNLRLIPERHFSGIEEATEFQKALTEAYSSPEAKEMIGGLKSACPNMSFYLTALKPRLLEFQKPVLEAFGFRPDFVGQQHMQRALGPYEADPEFLQRNIETEQLLGLPARG